MTHRKKTIFQEDASNYPTGAEFDSNAPWNKKPDVFIKKIRINYVAESFFVLLSNGKESVVSFAELLEEYERLNSDGYDSLKDMFGDDTEHTFANKAVRYLRDVENKNFSEYLLSVLENRNDLNETIKNKLSHFIKKIINEQLDSDYDNNFKNKNFNNNWIVYHINVLPGGKLDHVAIETDLQQKVAEEKVSEYETSYPNETFYAAKNEPIQSQYPLNQ